MPVASLVFLAVLAYPSYSNAADGDSTSTTSSQVIGTTTTTSEEVVDTTSTSTVNTTVEQNDLGGGLLETVTTDETTTVTTDTVEITTTTTTTEEVTTTTTTETHTEKTTSNYLSNPGFESSTSTTTAPSWNKSGSVFVGDTCGPAGGNCLQTGNESTQGGTVTQSVDLFDKLTKDQINSGFDIKYGSQVYSHPSNTSVPLCSQTTGDCKDSFSITLDIKDSAGNLLHKFEHIFNDINFSGWNTTDFFFQQTIPENNYTSSIATLELFGIDKGFESGTFGPAFDNTSIKAIYTAIDFIVSQTVEQVISTSTQVATEERSTTTVTTEETTELALIETPSTDDTTESLSIPEIETLDQPGGETMETFTIEVSESGGGSNGPTETFEITVNTESMEITVEPIGGMQDNMGGPEPQDGPSPTETVERVESEVEQQVAEVKPDDTNQSDPEPSSSEPNESSKPEAKEGGAEPQKSDDKPEPKQQAKSESKEKSDSKPKSKAEAKREITQKIVQNLVTRLGNSAQDQATQVALMNIISADITANQPKLLDQQTWYQDTGLKYNQQVPTNNRAQYFMFGGSDAKLNQMVDQQWKR